MTRVAAPSGSDSAAGTVAAPLRTLDALLEAVEPGQTACLRGGTYGGVEPRLHDPDSELTSYPGETATITSMLEVMNTAKRSHVHHLRFDATNFDSTAAIKIQADDAVLSDNHITKGGKSICVQVASSYVAYRVRIERNRIHNCGPANSKFDHQLYLEQAATRSCARTSSPATRVAGACTSTPTPTAASSSTTSSTATAAA